MRRAEEHAQAPVRRWLKRCGTAAGQLVDREISWRDLPEEGSHIAALLAVVADAM